MYQEFEKILLTEQEIQDIIKRLGDQINKDYAGKKLVLVCMLKGAAPFTMDLIKHIKVDMEVDFMQISSYHGGMCSTNVIFKKDIETNVIGKDVLIVDDIIDTGITMNEVMQLFKTRKVNSIEAVCLLDKPMHRKIDFNPKYVGKVIPDEFVVGYGLDYKEYLRNLPFIAVLAKSVYEGDE